jgi:ParB/RepB/Spo0J family partition protein
MKTASNHNGQVMNIPLNMIFADVQVRTKFNPESIAELAAEIAAHGVLQPIIVQQDGERFKLLIGERRFRALLLNKAATAPAIVATVAPTLARTVQLMENIQREDLCTKDLANAVHELWKELGSVTAVKERVHKSHSWVSKRLALALQCGPATTALLDAGVKDVELLYQFKKLEKLDPSRALRLVPDVIAGTIGRDQINDWILDTDGADKNTPAPDDKSQQSDLFLDPADGDRQAGTSNSEQLRQQYAAMYETLEAIRDLDKSLKPLVKAEQMRELARQCLASFA